MRRRQAEGLLKATKDGRHDTIHAFAGGSVLYASELQDSEGLWYALDVTKQQPDANLQLAAEDLLALQHRLASPDSPVRGEVVRLGRTASDSVLEAHVLALEDLETADTPLRWAGGADPCRGGYASRLVQQHLVIALQWQDSGTILQWRLLVRIPHEEQALHRMLSDPKWNTWWLDALVTYSTKLVRSNPVRLPPFDVAFDQPDWFALDVTKSPNLETNVAMGPEELRRLQERLGSGVPLDEGLTFPLRHVDGKLLEARVVKMSALQTASAPFYWQSGPSPCEGAYSSAVCAEQLVLIQQWRSSEPSMDGCTWRLIAYVPSTEDSLGRLLADPTWKGWWLDAVVPYSNRVVSAASDPGQTGMEDVRCQQLQLMTTEPAWNRLLEDVLRLAREQQATQLEISNVCAAQSALRILLEAQTADMSARVRHMQQVQDDLSGKSLQQQRALESGVAEGQLALQGSGDALHNLAQEQSHWQDLCQDLSKGQEALLKVVAKEQQERQALDERFSALEARQKEVMPDLSTVRHVRVAEGVDAEALQQQVRLCVGEMQEQIIRRMQTMPALQQQEEELERLIGSLARKLQAMEAAIKDIECTVNRPRSEGEPEVRIAGASSVNGTSSAAAAALLELELRLAKLEESVNTLQIFVPERREQDLLQDNTLDEHRRQIETTLQQLESRLVEVDRVGTSIRPSVIGAEVQTIRQEVQRWSEKRYEEFLSDVMRQFEELSKQVSSDSQVAASEAAAQWSQRFESDLSALRLEIQAAKSAGVASAAPPAATRNRSSVDVDNVADASIGVTTLQERARDAELSIKELKTELATEVARLWKAMPVKDDLSPPSIELQIEALRGQVLRDTRSLLDTSLTEIERRMLTELANVTKSVREERNRLPEFEVSVSRENHSKAEKLEERHQLLQAEVIRLSAAFDELSRRVEVGMEKRLAEQQQQQVVEEGLRGELARTAEELDATVRKVERLFHEQLASHRQQFEGLLDSRCVSVETNLAGALEQLRMQHWEQIAESVDAKLQGVTPAVAELRSKVQLFEEQWQDALLRVYSVTEEQMTTRFLSIQSDLETKLLESKAPRSARSSFSETTVVESPHRRSLGADAADAAASKVTESAIADLWMAVRSIEQKQVLEVACLKDELDGLITRRLASRDASLSSSLSGIQQQTEVLQQQVQHDVEQLRAEWTARALPASRQSASGTLSPVAVQVQHVDTVHTQSTVSSSSPSVSVSRRVVFAEDSQPVPPVPSLDLPCHESSPGVQDVSSPSVSQAELDLYDQVMRALSRCTEVMQNVEAIRDGLQRESASDSVVKASGTDSEEAFASSLRQELNGEIQSLAQSVTEELEAGFQVMTEKVRGIADGICRQYMEKEREVRSSLADDIEFSLERMDQSWRANLEQVRKESLNSSSRGDSREQLDLRTIETSLKHSLQEWARTSLLAEGTRPSKTERREDVAALAFTSSAARATEAKFMKELIQLSKEHQAGHLALRDLIVDTASRQQETFEDALQQIRQEMMSQIPATASAAASDIHASPSRPRRALDFGIGGSTSKDTWNDMESSVPRPTTLPSPSVPSSWKHRRATPQASMDWEEADIFRGGSTHRAGPSPAMSSIGGDGRHVVREWIPTAQVVPSVDASTDSLQPVVADLVAAELRRRPDLAAEAVGALDRVWREELEQMCGWLQTEQRALSGHITDVHSTADAYLHSAKLELEEKMYARLQVSVEELYEALQEDLRRLLLHTEGQDSVLATQRGRR